MKLRVKIKSIGDKLTGDNWKGRYLKLNWEERHEDGSVSINFLKAMAFDQQMEQVERELNAGDNALVDLSFSNTCSESGFFNNKARIVSIQKISDSEAGKGVAL